MENRNSTHYHSPPASTKRPFNVISSSIDDDSFDALMRKELLSQDEFDLIVRNSSPEQRLQFIRRQLYYYLSDTNLSRDQFYRKKILEDSAKTGAGNVLDVQYILTAKRMLAVNAGLEDIKKVITNDSDISLSLVEIGDHNYIKLHNPLPEYTGRRPIENKKKFGDTPDTFHIAGSIVTISNIPSEIVEWQVVKKAIHDSNKVKIRYISPINDSACYAWLYKSVDQDLLNSLDVTLNDKPIKIDLINTEEQYKNVVSAMNITILNSRSKELQRIKSSAMSRPIEIAGFVVRNFGCIRNLLSNLLANLDLHAKIPLESQAGTLLTFILDYHPHAFDKKGGDHRVLSHFEVGVSSKKDANDKKCFHVVTKHRQTGEDTKEDLSISKCLDGLRNAVHTLKKSDRTDFIKSLSVEHLSI